MPVQLRYTEPLEAVAETLELLGMSILLSLAPISPVRAVKYIMPSSADELLVMASAVILTDPALIAPRLKV